jgi:hypothetical protein
VKRPFSLFVLGLLLACGTSFAQNPDGETPANEGVCDDLHWATPGLFGLCVAFCEAQDCALEFGMDDPFANCRPSSPRLLEIYNRKKQPSDPPMPCIHEVGCPCWSQEELAGLRYPDGDPAEWVSGSFQLGTHERSWYIAYGAPSGERWYRTGVSSTRYGWYGDPECWIRDDCGGSEQGNCLNIERRFTITETEYAICAAQVEESGLDRSIPFAVIPPPAPCPLPPC